MAPNYQPVRLASDFPIQVFRQSEEKTQWQEWSKSGLSEISPGFFVTPDRVAWILDWQIIH